VLNLLLPPAPRRFLELGVVGEDPAEMMRVGCAIVLDQARRLDDRDQLGIDLAPIKAVPGNIIKRPGSHAACLRQHR